VWGKFVLRIPVQAGDKLRESAKGGFAVEIAVENVLDYHIEIGTL